MLNVLSYKYLGVVISSNLKWDKYIDYVVEKAYNKLWCPRITCKCDSSDIKLQVHVLLVRPVIEYASNVWDLYTTTNILKVEKVQRKAIRFVYGVYPRTVSPTALYANEGLETLKERRRDNRLEFKYLIVNEQLPIDNSLV